MNTTHNHHRLVLLLSMTVMLSSVILSYIFIEDSLEIRALGVLLTSLILWLTEVMPISITTLGMVCLLPCLGLMDFNEVVSNFGVNTSLFIMASSGVTVALEYSTLPTLSIQLVMKRYGSKPKRLVVILGLVIAVFSAFVSSLAICTLFSSLVSSALRSSNIQPKTSNVGKALMLVIPACAGIGGFMSPAGTPANILIIDTLAENGITVSFLQWCCIGFPIGLLATTMFTISVVFILKPDNINISFNEIVHPTRKDFYILTIVGIVISMWFIGSIFEILNPTLVAIIGLVVMFIPELDILDMDKFSKRVNWDIVISMGTVSILMTAISNTELLRDIALTLFRNILGLPPLITLCLISVCICFLRAFIPTTTAVVALFTPMLLSVSNVMGINITTMMLLLAFWGATALLLVYTEPIYLIAYKEGYFNQLDLLKVGIVPSLVLTVVASVGIYFLTMLVFNI